MDIAQVKQTVQINENADLGGLLPLVPDIAHLCIDLFCYRCPCLVLFIYIKLNSLFMLKTNAPRSQRATPLVPLERMHYLGYY